MNIISIKKPWAYGPLELLQHGLDHLKKDSGFDSRIALISIDNAVEIMIKIYLGLPTEITKISTLSKEKFEKKARNFFKLLKLFEEYAPDKIIGFELNVILWYHKIRNKLYHEGSGITVETARVEAYSEIAKIIFENLFSIPIDQDDSIVQPDGLIGEYLRNWANLDTLFNKSILKYKNYKNIEKTDHLKLYSFFEKYTPQEIEEILKELKKLYSFRNKIIHEADRVSESEIEKYNEKLKKYSKNLIQSAKKVVFLSYNTVDSKYFRIPEISRRLESYHDIDFVEYWEKEARENIIEYMKETLQKSNVMILFCSKNTMISKPVKSEWEAAYQQTRKGVMRIIPVFDNFDNVPNLLKPRISVKFSEDYFDSFIERLYNEINK